MMLGDITFGLQLRLRPDLTWLTVLRCLLTIWCHALCDWCAGICATLSTTCQCQFVGAIVPSFTFHHSTDRTLPSSWPSRYALPFCQCWYRLTAATVPTLSWVLTAATVPTLRSVLTAATVPTLSSMLTAATVPTLSWVLTAATVPTLSSMLTAWFNCNV